MLKLLQYLYRSFDFEDLWLSEDEHRSQSMEREGLDAAAQSVESAESAKKRHFGSLLMTRWGFARLLQSKCSHFVRESKGVLVRAALKLLMEYPLNDEYGLTVPRKCTKRPKERKKGKRNAAKRKRANKGGPKGKEDGVESVASTLPMPMRREQRHSYCGPDWDYEFDRMLRNEEALQRLIEEKQGKRGNDTTNTDKRDSPGLKGKKKGKS